ncbi:glutamine--fructose-6-phosphate transaminase (isomerizing) [Chloroflexota bacterium]
MCGIVGYIGDEPAISFLLKGLQNLEYRGYDSAGVATISDSKIWAGKDTGKLSEVKHKHGITELPGSIGIGHVRWATHGSVTPANAHPHFDCRKEIAVVHNGIIENHKELRDKLEPKHIFSSETDTEVIPHLIEEYIETGLSLEQAVIETVKQLRGSYALLAISLKNPDKIVATRKDSPLVIGVNGHRKFAASDALAFLDQTNKVVFLEDGETAVINKDIIFLDQEGKRINKEFTQLNWKCDQADKQGYDYYMMKEIVEAPYALRCALMQDREIITDMAMDIQRAKQVVITACGTSRYAALVGRYLFSKLSGKFCDVIMASEFHYFADSIDKDTLVIAVSQSGETADVIQGLKSARKNGATIFSIVNTIGSSISRMSKRVIYLNCGPEIGVAATKSFISQLTIFYLLAFTMADKLNEGVRDLIDLCPKIEKSLNGNNQKIMELAQRTKDKNDFYYIARGINFAIAAEGALKLKEVSYIHAEGMPAGELKHGTLALIEEGTPVVAICPKDYTFEETLNNITETKARKSFVIGVSEEDNSIFDEWIEIPKVDEIFYPLVSVVPLQLLAYHLAIARGKDPDHPRNLAKCVTVR